MVIMATAAICKAQLFIFFFIGNGSSNFDQIGYYYLGHVGPV